MLERLDVHARDANTRRTHPRDVVGDDPHRSQMHGMYIGPSASQVLADQAPMAVLSRGLTAQESGGRTKVRDRESALDLATRHQLEELRFVGRPVPFALLVLVEQPLRWSEP